MQQDNTQREGARFSGAVNADMNIGANATHTDKFNARQGHGFSAEQANHLCDILEGKDAAIVGGNNAKDGADRMVNGIPIQTKYCQTAQETVAAAFRDGQYRYLNADGSLMQLEVPKDQYEEAVKLMARRIERGEVPGVTDPSDAKQLVRKGHVTYEQAKNIAKFGTIDSLAFDAAQGVVISTSAFGVAASIAFAQSLWSGEPADIAIENALYAGISLGGAAFLNTIVTKQLMRTELNHVLTRSTDAVVRLLGPKASAAIANSLRSGANIYGAAAMQNTSKLLRGNLVSTAVMTVIFTVADFANAFRGRISGKQLFKHLVSTAGGLTGGTAGAIAAGVVLNLVVPGAGSIACVLASAAGAAAGGTASTTAANKIVGTFIEDDAVEMTRIIETAFVRLAQVYMLTAEETDIALDDLHRELSGGKLLDMYASADHAAYADALVRGIMERLIRGRCRICLPSETDMVCGLGKLVEDAQRGTGIFSNKITGTPDPVAIGRQLTGKELSPQAARKAWYATKQMNLAQQQAELRLGKMASDEALFQAKQAEIHRERDDLKAELAELLNDPR